MRIQYKRLHSFVIDDLSGLDPITLIIDQGHSDPVAGQYACGFTVVVYGTPWHAYFGSMSCPPLRFIRGCDVDYLVERFGNGELPSRRASRHERKYLARIFSALKAALSGDLFSTLKVALDSEALE